MTPVRGAGAAALRALCREVLDAPSVRFTLLGNSNGCRSLAVRAGARRVKCYECLSPDRARVVRILSGALRRQGIALPRVLARRGRVVVAEWAPGRPFDAGNTAAMRTMAAYQARLHAAAVPRSIPRRQTMPHLETLFERLLRHRGRVVAEATLADARDALVAARPAAAPWGVLHSDFIGTNLVSDAAGAPVCIDNEFLAAGYGQEWDLLNTLTVTFGGSAARQRRYVEAYRAHRDVHTLFTHHEYWQAWYDVKLAGKRLGEGDVREGLRHIRSLLRRAL